MDRRSRPPGDVSPAASATGRTVAAWRSTLTRPSAEPGLTILVADRQLELFTRSGWADVEAVDDASG